MMNQAFEGNILFRKREIPPGSRDDMDFDAGTADFAVFQGNRQCVKRQGRAAFHEKKGDDRYPAIPLDREETALLLMIRRLIWA